MKSIRYYTSLIVLLSITSLIAGCDKGFTEMNVNKVDPTTLNPDFILNHAIINTPVNRREAQLGYLLPIVQQVVSPFGTSLLGGNYNQVYRVATEKTWIEYYPNCIKSIIDVVDKAKKADSKNLYNIARIWKAYLFMVLTDQYGNIPYSEAGKGYLEGISNPKYDTQQAIYTDLLKELDEASAALSTTLPLSQSDIMYGGDITKWKQLGYSLLLRAAMRHTKVDPAKAQTYVTKAVAGGLMTSNAGNAFLRHNSQYQNPMSAALTGTEKANFYIAKPFLDFLKSKNDPRLPVLSIRYVGAVNGGQQTTARATTDPTRQIGMPMGYDDVSIVSTYAANGVVSLWDYSQTNITTVTSVTAPTFFVTYAQTQFLLAEAVHRGWATGNAASIYSNAIKAHMEQLSIYGAAATITPAAITAYLAANPLTVGNELADINTQFWAASFLDGAEAFANFRRSGYPTLTPNPYPGSAVPGAFIRRMIYPESEYVVNKGNLDEAVKQQGPDNLSTRVWWDK